MPLLDPESFERRRQRFANIPFIQALGMELHDLGEGLAETRLTVRPEHAQQNGFVHAGVLATMADHTAGAAAATLIAAHEAILTAEFKINLLRPAQTTRLICRSQVLKPGRRLSIAESRLYGEEKPDTLLAMAIVTLAVLQTDQA